MTTCQPRKHSSVPTSDRTNKARPATTQSHQIRGIITATSRAPPLGFQSTSSSFLSYAKAHSPQPPPHPHHRRPPPPPTSPSPSHGEGAASACAGAPAPLLRLPATLSGRPRRSTPTRTRTSSSSPCGSAGCGAVPLPLPRPAPLHARAALLAGFLLWPADPDVSVARLRLAHVSVSARPTVRVTISAALKVRVRNPDLFALDYGRLDVDIGYRGAPLGRVTSGGGRVARAPSPTSTPTSASTA